jgi:putative SOS response-associated peptidase YedK
MLAGMCGRFVQDLTPEEMQLAFEIDRVGRLPPGPSYNLAPTQRAAVVRLDAEGRREAVGLRWGLLPMWAKDAKMGASMINARAETLAEKPAFRTAFKKGRRCLVPARAFYEWRRDGKAKAAHAIGLGDGAPMAFAGLWEWNEKLGDDEGPLETFTVVTTGPNALMERIHDRMPVILPRETWRAWLDPGSDPAELVRLLVAHPPEVMRAWRVADAVGNVRNQGPELLAPLGVPPDAA